MQDWEIALAHARAVYGAWALSNGENPNIVVHPHGAVRHKPNHWGRWDGPKAWEYLKTNGHDSVTAGRCKCGATF